jgi:hypothetical protein
MCEYNLKAGKPEKVLELELELAKQWLANHAEHCGVLVPPWPHAGLCHLPMPEVLASLSPSEVYLLLLQVSGESFGLRLQFAEG